MGAYDLATPEHKRTIDELLVDTRANDGLAPLDVAQFWRDQEEAARDPFGEHIRQLPLGASLTRECVFDELGEELDFRRYQNEDEDWALDLNKRYNDLAEGIVGRRLLPEGKRDPERQWPPVKALHDIFEAENIWEGGRGGSWWLQQCASTPDELSRLLDRVEARLEVLRDFLLPENWDDEKARLTALGGKVVSYRGQRGPCTFACSIFGPENLILLYYDDPDLMKRFSDVLTRAILEMARVLDVEGGYSPETAPRGWSWADDNCCLFTPALYEHFAMPIHRAVFGRYAPDPGDRRYQHSDSDMQHLLPQLRELGLTGTNFGPTLSVRAIREHCPAAVIEGQLAPFTYSRNEEANMVAELLRDFEQAREARGLVFATAGSVNNGSRLTGMRLLMSAIQRSCRYDSL